MRHVMAEITVFLRLNKKDSNAIRDVESETFIRIKYKSEGEKEVDNEIDRGKK